MTTILQRYGTLVVCGRQRSLVTIDMTRGKVVGEDKSFGDVQFIGIKRSARHLCAGSVDGKVSPWVCVVHYAEPSATQVYMLDPRTLKSQHVVECYAGGLQDFDASQNLICATGFAPSMRLVELPSSTVFLTLLTSATCRYGQQVVDAQIKIFDIRTMRQLPPSQVRLRFKRIAPSATSLTPIVYKPRAPGPPCDQPTLCLSAAARIHIPGYA